MEGNNGTNANTDTPNAEQPQPAAAPTTPAPETAKKPFYKKGWFWGTVIAVAAVAGGVAAYFVAGGDDATAE